MRRFLAAMAVMTFMNAAVGCATESTRPTLRLGAIFPLSGSAGSLGSEELAGVKMAAQLVNADGGVDGKRIAFDVRNVTSVDDAARAVASLRHDGARIVIGGYASDLSMAASAATARQGLVYWEAGAVADRLTGRGLPGVFRVGATGGELGANAGQFVVSQIAPRLHRAPAALSAVAVVADDDYAHSVATSAERVLRAAGVHVSQVTYEPGAPLWAPVLAAVRASRANILVLASHIPDGIAFRRAFLAAHLHVDAFIGSTMAQCLPNFGDALGPDAVGVFASDRPDESFDPAKLPITGERLYERLAAAWRHAYGRPLSEEALSGFTAGWVLLHDILRPAAATGPLTIAAVERAARAVNLPEGSLPNGAGVKFATGADRLGQNIRAAAVIWQWQAVRHSVVVWPPAYADGVVRMVPLPR